MTCVDTIKAPIYDGADNIISLVLIADGDVLADLSAVTRVVVDLDGSQIIDSDVVGGSVIWYNEQELYRGQLVDVLRLQLGDQGLIPGSYPDVAITVYDAIYTNGLRVENDILFTVT